MNPYIFKSTLDNSRTLTESLGMKNVSRYIKDVKMLRNTTLNPSSQLSSRLTRLCFAEAKSQRPWNTLSCYVLVSGAGIAGKMTGCVGGGAEGGGGGRLCL